MPHENRREGTCKDKMWRKKCLKKKNAGSCNNKSVKEKCQKTCGFCGRCLAYKMFHSDIEYSISLISYSITT